MQRRDDGLGGTRTLTRCALLCAIALTIFMVEAQLIPLIPIPGVKMGLANIVTVYAIYALGAGNALFILLGRVFLGAVFSGQMMTIFYSLGGGLLSWVTLLVLHRIFDEKQMWLASAFSAVAHNIGQLIVAALIMRTWAVVGYLPYLILAGVCAGVFTGICAQLLFGRIERRQRK